MIEDVGRSLNPAIDIGQVEGGFIQGVGWLTTEELCVGRQGATPHARAVDLQDPARVATCRAIFNVKLAEWSVNKEPAIGRSKAVGEPPFVPRL